MRAQHNVNGRTEGVPDAGQDVMTKAHLQNEGELKTLTIILTSLIQTHVWEPIMIVHIKNDSLIQLFSYLDSQLANGGVRISESTLYLTTVNTFIL